MMAKEGQGEGAISGIEETGCFWKGNLQGTKPKDHIRGHILGYEKKVAHSAIDL